METGWFSSIDYLYFFRDCSKLSICFPEITIGFEQSTYTVQEAPQATVATVCAIILEGSVQIGIGFTFGTMDGLAGT